MHSIPRFYTNKRYNFGQVIKIEKCNFSGPNFKNTQIMAISSSPWMIWPFLNFASSSVELDPLMNDSHFYHKNDSENIM